MTLSDAAIPVPLRVLFRGIGQVFFQGNAFTGICFALGILVVSPLMALGLVAGSAIGAVTAKLLKFDEAELLDGIYGFNAALVGIATLFFFRPGLASLGLLVVGCVVATVATRLMRRFVPFPTYTTPFIVTTWAVFFLGLALGAARVEAGGPLVGVGWTQAVAHGVSQVMFQASVWTALLFVVGIALSDWRHASWVVAGAVVGTLVASFHATTTSSGLDPEQLVTRTLPDDIALGLFGYNATLTAVALFLAKRSLIAPLLGILASVPITEFFPSLGIPALTAPFVLATWLVLGLGWIERRYFVETGATPTA
jgi:urea transporter